MGEAAARCIRRRAFALLAVVAITATVQASSAGAGTKKIPSKTSITVTQETTASLSISWQRVRTAAGYDVYLNGTNNGKTQATTYTFSNLRCGATYTLGVDAFTNKGVRSSIVSVVASTAACPVATGSNDTTPPTPPASLSQGATTATSISLLWSASLDNVGVAGYDLFVNGSKVGTSVAPTYAFTNLSCGRSYTLAVDAYDTSGNRSQSAAVQASTSPCADTSPPTTPGLPTQTGSTTTSISLLWSASLDNVGVAGYDLFVNGNKVGTTTATTYTFANLSCGTSYTLAVDAYDAAGNRSQRSALSGTTSACTNATAPPPPPPTNNCTSVLTPSTADTLDTQFNDPAKGNVVCLHGGNYAAASVFTGLTRSGTSSQRITLQSYPGELATIHGYLGIDSNWVMLTNLKIDNTNTFTSDSHGECPSGVYYGSLTVSGSNDVLDHNEIYASNQAHSANGVLVHGSNTDIRFNKIHDLGQCPNHDHGIYDSGTRTQIDGNWLWNLPNGWGVQLYPGDSNTHIYGNVIDGATSGFAVCSTGSNNLIENNVVSNSVGGGQAGSGSLVSGCGPQGSSTNNVVRNNDSFNNPGGFGSVAGITYSGNISADPQFVDAASHDYEVLPASPVVSWSLWTGS
jgi:parallel beta-helix repeat protein